MPKKDSRVTPDKKGEAGSADSLRKPQSSILLLAEAVDSMLADLVAIASGGSIEPEMLYNDVRSRLDEIYGRKGK